MKHCFFLKFALVFCLLFIYRVAHEMSYRWLCT